MYTVILVEQYMSEARIQDFVKGRAQLLRPEFAESCKLSEPLVAEIQDLLKVFDAEIYILPHSRDSFSLIFAS